MWPFTRQPVTPPDAGLPPARAFVHVQTAAEAMAAGTPLPAVQVIRGRELDEAGDVEGAVEHYRAAIDAGTTSPDAFCRLAELHRARGDAACEQQVLRHAVEALTATGHHAAAQFRRRLRDC